MEYKNNKGIIYYLNSKVVKFGGKEKTIYFFSRDKRDSYCDKFPEGYIVVENKKSGLPLLKPKKLT